MKKLAIITSHPIQYNAPLFRLLTERGNISLKVFYTWGQTEQGFVYDPDFKRSFKWDIPLLDGYEKEFVENISKDPGAGHFNGIINKNLLQRIDIYKPDAILVYGWSFKSHLQVLRHYKGKVKILFRGDSTLLDEKNGASLKKTARRIFLTWIYRHIDAALYTGVANKQYYLAHGLHEDELHYAPHAVENERFFENEEQNEADAIEWRKLLGIPANAIVFLFAGKLEPKKDPLIMIESFRTINDETARLLIVGNGVLEAEVKQRAAQDRRILFLDFQNQQQMPVIYRIGDVFLLPSKGPGETWGLSVNEAMACSKPVIVSDKCGCSKDLVTDNGIIFPAGNQEALEEALHFFLVSKEQIPAMGCKGRERIEQFSFKKIAERIEAFV